MLGGCPVCGNVFTCHSVYMDTARFKEKKEMTIEGLLTEVILGFPNLIGLVLLAYYLSGEVKENRRLSEIMKEQLINCLRDKKEAD